MKNLVTLKYLNTFSVDVCALCVVEVHTEYELLIFWKKFVRLGVFILFLGAGSNVLFLENYNGVVLLNRIKGVTISEDLNYWYLHVCSGELWHELVVYSLRKNIPGLENLALIPGYVGAAPIHNIGAYGVEFKKFCQYVDFFNLDIKKKIRFTADECQFVYRNSIFHRIDFNYVIVAVGLRVNKHWIPVLNYDGLDQFDVRTVTPSKIFDTVCMIRRQKIPNPIISGNAGSFFKNPLVTIKSMKYFLYKYSDMPVYIYQDNLVKLSARWLIDYSCRIGQYRFGKAEMYKNQSVLINVDQQATVHDIIRLASYIHDKVVENFHICLEPEVQFIANFGKIDGTKLLSTEDSVSYNNIIGI